MKTFIQAKLGLTALFIYLFLAIPSVKADVPYIYQVIVVTGGSFGAPGNHVKFGAYFPDTKKFTVFDSVPGNYTNEAIIADDANRRVALLTADDRIYKYDLNTYKRLDSVKVPGIQRMAVYDSILVVSRGFGAQKEFVQFYNLRTMDLLESDTIVSTFTEGIAVDEFHDRVYVAVRGAWPDYTSEGTIAVYNANTFKFLNYITLDTNARSISSLHFGERDNMLYAAAPTKGYLVAYDVKDSTYTAMEVTGLQNILSYETGRFRMDPNSLLLQTTAGIRRFNMFNGKFDTAYNIPIVIERGATGLAGKFDVYVTQTDFFSYGRMLVINREGKVADTIPTDIAPQALAVDQRLNLSIAEGKSVMPLQAYPNPFGHQLSFTAPVTGKLMVNVKDMQGKVVYQSSLTAEKGQAKQLDLASLRKGIYFLQLSASEGMYNAKVIKY